MSKSSRKSSNDLLKTVGGVALILILFVVILRAALAPLYQEVAQIEARQDLQPNANGGGGGNGGSDFGGDDQSEENINVNLGGIAGLFNWGLGWAWGGPGWYSGPDYGWWGANVWNGWRNWWTGDNWNGGDNRVWNGNVNDSRTREFNDNHSDDQRQNDNFRGDNFRHEDGGDRREFHEEGGSHHGGGHEGGGRR
jgi:hypothetical protein